MIIAIVGAGALGSLFGGLLAQRGHKVWLYNPSNVEHIRTVRSQGLTIKTPEGNAYNVQVPATERMEEIPLSVDVVGLFVKAYRTGEALKQAHPLISEGTWLLSLQNGVGFEDLLRSCSKGRVLRGTTSQGATFLAPGVIRWAGRGPTRLGSLVPTDDKRREQIDLIIRALNDAEIEACYEPDVERLIWEKLLVSAAINPLTALFDVPNGALLTHPELHEILQYVVREALAIAAHHGVALSAEEAIARVEEVCRATAENLSSMLQDVRRGRRTEVEFINGAIVREGERLGIPTPLHRLLLELMRQKHSTCK